MTLKTIVSDVEGRESIRLFKMEKARKSPMVPLLWVPLY